MANRSEDRFIMRYLRFLALLTFVFTTQASFADSSSELNAYLNKFLADAATTKDSDPLFTFENGRIHIGGKVVRINAISESSDIHQGNFLEGARFEVQVDSKTEPALLMGAFAVASTKEKAVEQVVMKWFSEFGISLFYALAQLPTELRIGEFSVYPGDMAIQYKRPENSWLDESKAMHNRILATIAEHLPKPESGKLHTVDLEITVDPNGNVEGRVRVDGRVSSPAVEVIRKLDWPKGQYMFRQKYVLTSGTTD